MAGDLDFASTGFLSAIALMTAGVKSFFAIATQDSYATVEGILGSYPLSLPDPHNQINSCILLSIASSRNVATPA
jgi:hypothetical protein